MKGRALSVLIVSCAMAFTPLVLLASPSQQRVLGDELSNELDAFESGGEILSNAKIWLAPSANAYLIRADHSNRVVAMKRIGTKGLEIQFRYERASNFPIAVRFAGREWIYPNSVAGGAQKSIIDQDEYDHLWSSMQDSVQYNWDTGFGYTSSWGAVVKTPEQIADCEQSHTGRFLRAEMEAAAAVPAR